MRRTVRILAIDGGGVRGLLPARFLMELEAMSGRPLHSLFDVIAGTSVGGIIALAYAAPGPDGNGFPAAQVVEDLHEWLPAVFPPLQAAASIEGLRDVHERHALSQLVGAALLPHHFGNARYTAAALEDRVLGAFGDARLSDTLTDVVVPAYDMHGGQPVVFRSRDARGQTSTHRNPKLVEVARATSAAPTYLPPLRLLDDPDESVLIDGAVVANNPAAIAYLDGLECYRNDDGSAPDVVLLSVGTGRPSTQQPSYEEVFTRNWASIGMGLLGVVLNGASEMSHQLVDRMLSGKPAPNSYLRVQPTLTDGASLHIDDATPANLDALTRCAEATIEAHRPELEELVAVLSELPSLPQQPAGSSAS
ncbi:MAG: patatin-like phospholipase family protein [Frankiaceae bacterium]|nr:patatin-like phospholipase family protein [Frankiaceae bacterium]MBV9369265.1 patatin-like phospholipase family protein [Frankiales bacterium]